MATKIEQKAAALAPADKQAENELDVLHPERELHIGGRLMIVREYGHVEWLRLLPRAAPLVDSLASRMDQASDISYEEALGFIALHIDGLAPLICQAAGITIAEFEALQPDQGELLIMAWWGTNGRFFAKRAWWRAYMEKTFHQPLDTAASTPPSSPTATSEPTSAATPSAS